MPALAEFSAEAGKTKAWKMKKTNANVRFAPRERRIRRFKKN